MFTLAEGPKGNKKPPVLEKKGTGILRRIAYWLIQEIMEALGIKLLGESLAWPSAMLSAKDVCFLLKSDRHAVVVAFSFPCTLLMKCFQVVFWTYMDDSISFLAIQWGQAWHSTRNAVSQLWQRSCQSSCLRIPPQIVAFKSAHPAQQKKIFQLLFVVISSSPRLFIPFSGTICKPSLYSTFGFNLNKLASSMPPCRAMKQWCGPGQHAAEVIRMLAVVEDKIKALRVL